MNALEFLRKPDRPGVKPIYAVFGEDAFLRLAVVEAIGRVALGEEGGGPGLTRFPGEQAELADVLDEVRTLPFLSRRRVAVVEGADPFVTAHRKELEAYAERPAEAGTLVLAVKSWPANTKLAKLVEKVGLSIDCKAPSERELPDWLRTLAQDRWSVHLERDAAALLVELIGVEVGLLAAEIEKLATYVGDRQTIRRADVAQLVGAGRVEKIFKVLDAATTGRAAEALADLDRLIASGEHPVGLLAAMSASLRKLHHAGELRRSGLGLPQACRDAGIPPFAVEATRAQHAHLGPTRVAQLPAWVLQADLDLKGFSTLAPRTILERLIVQLARPRAD
ncbi:MAG: DNA polymerase III subunit delta [Isosphaeraceae bacterium]|nr:DNA polymerase III subunit delta [Isosphaeraceae bacterium]